MIYLTILTSLYILTISSYCLAYYYYQTPHTVGTIIFSFMFLGAFITVSRSKEIKKILLERSRYNLFEVINDINKKSIFEFDLPTTIYKIYIATDSIYSNLHIAQDCS